jgi:hypothetical protein
LNFGYYYDRSPIIAYDDEVAPSYSMSEFESSTVPGCRAPHFWLEDGRSFYDVMDTGFALLRLDRAAEVAPLTGAAQQRGIPVQVIDVTPETAGPAYRQRLVLVRPDQHVAWRGKELPARPDDLLALITGHAAPVPSSNPA